MSGCWEKFVWWVVGGGGGTAVTPSLSPLSLEFRLGLLTWTLDFGIGLGL